MTFGELYDRLNEVREAERAVREAEMSIGHGGNADTMRIKHDWLKHVEAALSNLRNEPLEIEP